MISPFIKLSLITAGSIFAASSLFAQQENKPQAEPLAGTIIFYNGDSISGVINDWNNDYLAITCPDFIDPVKFSTEKILTITLEDKGNPNIVADTNQDETTLIINNRNNQHGQNGVIKGGFSNIDDKYVTLNTSFAGEIKALKKFITKMEIDSKKGYLYLGPKSIDEWQNNSIKLTWSYRNNSLISSAIQGNIAQDIATPDDAKLSFDLSWKEDEQLTLYLFSSDHEQSNPDGYYMLTLQKGRATIIKYADGRQSTHLISEINMNRRNQMHLGLNQRIPTQREMHANYEIYMSKTKGEFHIFRNGIKLDKLSDPNPMPKKFGTSLHLISGDRSPIRIKNLNLSNWSGNIPSPIDSETFAKAKGEGERILLKNGDILLGKIGKINDGLMEVETLYAPLRIPIIRMRSVDLTSSNLKEEPIMYENDMKCWYKDSGWIILKPISIDKNILTAYHQALGENKFDLNAFKRIDLHIYDKEANTKRISDSW